MFPEIFLEESFCTIPLGAGGPTKHFSPFLLIPYFSHLPVVAFNVVLG